MLWMSQNYTYKDLEFSLERLDGVTVDQRFGENLDVYAYNNEPFLVHFLHSKPLELTLRCEPFLADSLKEQYESVLNAHNLDPRKWVTVLATDQLPEGFIHDLVVHAYTRVGGSLL